MKLSYLARAAGLAIFCVALVPAASITSYSLSFNGVSIGGGANNVSQFVGDGSGYQVDGTLDLYNLTTGLPVTGQPLAGGYAFRFTNAIISCKAIGSSCGPALFQFAVTINFDGPGAGNPAGSFRLDGTGTGTGGTLLSADVFGAGANTGSIANVSTIGAFNQSIALAPGFFGGTSTQQMLMVLQLDSMNDGGSITLPSSLSASVGVSAVPEPGSTALVAAGLLGAVWFRRRIQ